MRDIFSLYFILDLRFYHTFSIYDIKCDYNELLTFFSYIRRCFLYIKINKNRETSDENGISHILMGISGSCGQIAYAYTRS